MPLKKARLRISDYNQTRKARLSKQEKRIVMVSLSLTSMVDMFAILVIFLLTNASTVAQWVEVSKGIELPRAKMGEPPQKAATLQVANETVYADNKPISIDAVKGWLSRRPKEEKKAGYVNIVAHQKTSFGLIKRVIATCQEAGFQNVNLAVQPKG